MIHRLAGDVCPGFPPVGPIDQEPLKPTVFMEVAATIVPLLFIALVLERRASFGLHETVPRPVKGVARFIEAALTLMILITLITAEGIALESLRRGHATAADELAVMRVLGLGAFLLSIPILIGLAREINGPGASADRMGFTVSGLMLAGFLGSGLLYVLIS